MAYADPGGCDDSGDPVACCDPMGCGGPMAGGDPIDCGDPVACVLRGSDIMTQSCSGRRAWSGVRAAVGHTR